MLPVTAQRSILESATNRFLASPKLNVTTQVAHYSQLKFVHHIKSSQVTSVGHFGELTLILDFRNADHEHVTDD